MIYRFFKPEKLSQILEIRETFKKIFKSLCLNLVAFWLCFFFAQINLHIYIHKLHVLHILYINHTYIYIYLSISYIDVKIYWTFLQSTSVFSKMSQTDKILWRNTRERQFQNEEGQSLKKFFDLQK